MESLDNQITTSGIGRSGIAAVAAVLLMSACNLETPETRAAPLPPGADGSVQVTDNHVEPTTQMDSVLLDVQNALKSRQQDYDAVIRDARARGAAGGALQGGLLGMLVTGSAEGAIVGGLAGSAIGYSVSGEAATQLVEEHRNFLIRKWSLQAVLDAARVDTANTRFDLLLSKRALEAASTGQSDPDAIARNVQFLSAFQERAETRAVALSEVVPLFAGNQEAVDQLTAELREQVAMLSDFRSNLKRLVNHNE